MYVLVALIVLLNLLIAVMTKSYERTLEGGAIEWRVHRARQIIRLEMLALPFVDPHVGYKRKSHHYYQYMFETKKKDEDVLEKKVDQIQQQQQQILKLLEEKSQVQEIDHLAARDRQGLPQISVPQLQDAHAQLSSKSLPDRVPSTADSPHQIDKQSLSRARSAPDGLVQPSSTQDQRRGSALVDYFVARSPDSKGRKEGTTSKFGAVMQTMSDHV